MFSGGQERVKMNAVQFTLDGFELLFFSAISTF